MSLTRDLRSNRFWRQFVTHTLAAIGVIAALIGIYDVFVPNMLEKIDFPEVLAVPGLAILYAGWRSWPYPIEQHYSSPNTKIRVLADDLFEQDHNLVIGMTDTFDVATPHIISANSVQGQFLARVYANDVAELEADLGRALAPITPIGRVEKQGNQDRYPCGTVATIRHQRKLYFCVAYTQMDENCNVRSSMGILWESLNQLWKEVRKRSNGDTVAIPVIGLGQSGMSTILPIQDSIRFIILSFMFTSRQERVCDGLEIVVRKEDEKRVDMLEIQDFLRSLRQG